MTLSRNQNSSIQNLNENALYSEVIVPMELQHLSTQIFAHRLTIKPHTHEVMHVIVVATYQKAIQSI